MKVSAQRVQDALTARGMGHRVEELAASTRSASEAAVAVGCEVAQIVKSLVFRGKATGQAVLVLASGAHRVDTAKLERFAGEPLEKADADFVREATGFAIGGVPPAFHARPLLTFVDSGLLRFEALWTAAGTPNAVFKLTPTELLALSGGTAVDLTENPIEDPALYRLARHL